MGQDVVDFLEEDDIAQGASAATIMKELAEMSDKLLKLEFDYVTAQEKADQAKKLYDEFRTIDIPNAFRLNGVLELATSSGARVSIKKVYHCSPNKNDADQAFMCSWLDKNGGKDLIKQTISVAPQAIPILKENKIAYAERNEVNTTSLKAFLRRAIGDDKSPGTIALEDIPTCIHFYCHDEADVKV